MGASDQHDVSREGAVAGAVAGKQGGEDVCGLHVGAVVVARVSASLRMATEMVLCTAGAGGYGKGQW